MMADLPPGDATSSQVAQPCIAEAWDAKPNMARPNMARRSQTTVILKRNRIHQFGYR